MKSPAVIAVALISVLILSGCGAGKVGRVATKTVSFAGKTAAKTTVAVAKVGGNVAATTAKTTIQTTGTVVSAIAKSGFVTIKDFGTGVSRQIPYAEGMKLYAATKTAEFDTYLKAFEILRNGAVIRSDWQKMKTSQGNPSLKSGDVILVKRLAKNSAKIAKRG